MLATISPSLRLSRLIHIVGEVHVGLFKMGLVDRGSGHILLELCLFCSTKLAIISTLVLMLSLMTIFIHNMREKGIGLAHSYDKTPF